MIDSFLLHRAKKETFPELFLKVKGKASLSLSLCCLSVCLSVGQQEKHKNISLKMGILNIATILKKQGMCLDLS